MGEQIMVGAMKIKWTQELKKSFAVAYITGLDMEGIDKND
jgi:hypothetical protein